MFKKIKELLSNDSNMKPDEFEKLCKSYLPNCVIKYEGTCGLCCYNGGTDILDIKVSLLEMVDSVFMTNGEMLLSQKI